MLRLGLLHSGEHWIGALILPTMMEVSDDFMEGERRRGERGGRGTVPFRKFLRLNIGRISSVPFMLVKGHSCLFDMEKCLSSAMYLKL